MPTSTIFEVERDGAALVVTPRCNVTSFADEDVQNELDLILKRIQEPDVVHLVLDFGHVSYFGSSMLEAIRAIARRVREQHGNLALCRVSTVGLEILHIARFDTLWPIYPTRPEALAAVQHA